LAAVEAEYNDILARMLIDELKKYDPNQPRVPAGNANGRQWTSGGGSSGSSKKPSSNLSPKLPSRNPDVLSEEGEEQVMMARPLIRLLTKPKVIKLPKKVGGIESTSHGAVRLTQRKIANNEVKAAIKSAEKSGNVIAKMGKYNTPQKVYKGSNGVTVIIETSGSNAGKIITTYRH
jgi:hypothetical protein